MAGDHDDVRRRVEDLLAEHDPRNCEPAQFLGAQFDRGLAWVHFPPGRGGLGVPAHLQAEVDQSLTAVGAPSALHRNVIGVGMAAPTLLAHGSAAQLDRLLRPLWTGEEIWCQLFSEPGAGSDVAGLASRAVRDGPDWVVNGQKVWTSFGDVATWGLLVARSDPDAVKHRGLTYFVLDMAAAGVAVRPLVQLTGDAEFNEVYLTDVRVPDEARLGGVGEGWRVVLTTLMNERVAIGGQVPARDTGMIGTALALWRRGGHADPVRRDELVRHWVDAEVLRLTSVRAGQRRAAGAPGPEGSIGKIVSAELNQRISAFAVGLLGMAGSLLPEGYRMRRPTREELGRHGPQLQMLRSVGNSIEGGTTEIMRNILAERVLGLPGDVRVDRDVPWNTVPRS